MDEISLIGLQYHASHGVYENEREEGNDFQVDLIFETDLEKPGKADDLAATIDYQQAEQMVAGVMQAAPVHLLETLAANIGDALFNHFSNAQKLTVRIRKLHPPLQTAAEYAQIVRSWTR